MIPQCAVCVCCGHLITASIFSNHTTILLICPSCFNLRFIFSVTVKNKACLPALGVSSRPEGGECGRLRLNILGVEHIWLSKTGVFAGALKMSLSLCAVELSQPSSEALTVSSSNQSEFSGPSAPIKRRRKKKENKNSKLKLKVNNALWQNAKMFTFILYKHKQHIAYDFEIKKEPFPSSFSLLKLES